MVGQATVTTAASAIAVASVPRAYAVSVSTIGAEVVAGVEQGLSGAPGSSGIYQETLRITAQNAIPALTKPWKDAPGAFANIIIGAATLVSGGGAVTFEDGSTQVSFDPAAAGFNIDPGDVVVAQYSIA